MRNWLTIGACLGGLNDGIIVRLGVVLLLNTIRSDVGRGHQIWWLGRPVGARVTAFRRAGCHPAAGPPPSVPKTRVITTTETRILVAHYENQMRKVLFTWMVIFKHFQTFPTFSKPTLTHSTRLTYTYTTVYITEST